MTGRMATAGESARPIKRALVEVDLGRRGSLADRLFASRAGDLHRLRAGDPVIAIQARHPRARAARRSSPSRCLMARESAAGRERGMAMNLYGHDRRGDGGRPVAGRGAHRFAGLGVDPTGQGADGPARSRSREARRRARVAVPSTTVIASFARRRGRRPRGRRAFRARAMAAGERERVGSAAWAWKLPSPERKLDLTAGGGVGERRLASVRVAWQRSGGTPPIAG
jgi:hypothetical protein